MRLKELTISGLLLGLAVLVTLNGSTLWGQESQLCLDGFCIGQTIQDARFATIQWLIPSKNLETVRCAGIGCQPGNAFRGYPADMQEALSSALALMYMKSYNLITPKNLATLRHYQYECNPSPDGVWAEGQRRFIGIYRSKPSNYLTVVGLRLINGELTVYRIARQFPFHNKVEFLSLAKQITAKYGLRILIYDGISDNAYAAVIKQQKDGWFGRSTLFNPDDRSDLDAELVLIGVAPSGETNR